MRRVLILNNIPAPYFDPLFAKLADSGNWMLRVCYTSSWNQNAGWVEKPLPETNHRVVILDRAREGLTRRLGSPISAALSLLDEMNRDRPDYAIIYGYTLLPQVFAILWSSLLGIPFAVIGDANVHADTARGFRRFVKQLWLRLVISQASALICIGTANRKFWESYGAPAEKLFSAGYAVDNEHIANAVAKARADSAALRAELDVVAETVFLFVGRLVKRKNVDLIISAMKQLDSNRIALVVVGQGQERASLENLAGKDPRIVFCGAVPQSDLPRYYAIADALVLPASDEPWGLVINEAMAGGLAVIAHQHCGAAVDLVSTDNGASLGSLDVAELTGVMSRIAADESLRERMKASSLRKIRDWSIDNAARGIIEAVSQTSRTPLRDSRQVREAE